MSIRFVSDEQRNWTGKISVWKKGKILSLDYQRHYYCLCLYFHRYSSEAGYIPWSWEITSFFFILLAKISHLKKISGLLSNDATYSWESPKKQRLKTLYWKKLKLKGILIRIQIEWTNIFNLRTSDNAGKPKNMLSLYKDLITTKNKYNNVKKLLNLNEYDLLSGIFCRLYVYKLKFIC